MAVLRQIVAHDFRLRHVVERVLDVVVAQHAIDLGDVQRAVMEGDAVRSVEIVRDDADRRLEPCAGRAADRVDLAAARASADEQRAALPSAIERAPGTWSA